MDEGWLAVIIYAVIFVFGVVVSLVGLKMNDRPDVFKTGVALMGFGALFAVLLGLDRGLKKNDLVDGSECVYDSQCTSSSCVSATHDGKGMICTEKAAEEPIVL